MNFIFLLMLALRSIVRNKLRSGLTMLGVIIGVGSVVAMVAIGNGAKDSIQQSISKMGTDLFYVRPGAVSSGGVSWGAGSIKTLTTDDAEALAEECNLISYTSPVIRHRVQVVYGDKNWSPDSMQGVGADYYKIKKWDVSEGGWFSEQEVRSGAKVCLFGTTIAKELFPHTSPVGKIVRVANVPMEVIGVLTSKGTNLWGSDDDSQVIMPWTTMRQRISTSGKSRKKINRVLVGATSTALLPQAMEQAKELLRYRHKIKDGAADDFRVYELSSWTDSYKDTSENMSTLIMAIASISLLVGGIGIMNIMLVSVTERTREIGVRMAVGAKSKHILMQFLAEAITLSTIGGLLGLVLALVAAPLITYFVNWPTLFSVDSMIIAFAFSLGIGIIFGFYPSWKASRMDPIDCLRYE
jgi:putative ABC transport system permease protein